jgi:hypothetical protein
MKPALYSSIFALVAMSILIATGACSDPPPKPKKPRSLIEARAIVLKTFKELDGFKLTSQKEIGLGGHPGVRMDAVWKHEGRPRRGIIYLVDSPELFNVIHYTAPDEDGIFEVGYPEFQQMIKSLKSISDGHDLVVVTKDDQKIMRSPDLLLEIHYPARWEYSLDEVNRAIVFSGPREKPTWLTTVSFSAVQKWGVGS